MKRLPVVPTIVVAVAVAAMLALGCWQLLDRRPKKLAYLQQLSLNPARPPIALPRAPDEALLFRHARGACLKPGDIARTGAGASGFRLIAHCGTGSDAPGLAVQLGTTRDPTAIVAWTGGSVGGVISHAPDARPLIAGLFDRSPGALMLVLDQPVAGLAPNGHPNLDSVPNNHLAYAVQWFLFAGIATIVYALAVMRRR